LQVLVLVLVQVLVLVLLVLVQAQQVRTPGNIAVYTVRHYLVCAPV
tara:strand:- start:505 stop:642 length:138 start_codon:yes stop_codon:yes gene_type:complete